MFNILVLLDVQNNLKETSPFLSAQMALVSIFLQIFIVPGKYNFGKKSESQANMHKIQYQICLTENTEKGQSYKFNGQTLFATIF